MVDSQSRAKVRRILKDAALGRISNFEAENRFLDLLDAKGDPIVFALFRTVREIGGEREGFLARVFAKGTPMRNRLCRWLFFLKTPLEYEWPETRLAPGLRDLYRPTWFDKLLGGRSRAIRISKAFCDHGDYHVWPFAREADLNAARIACRKAHAL